MRMEARLLPIGQKMLKHTGYITRGLPPVGRCQKYRNELNTDR